MPNERPTQPCWACHTINWWYRPASLGGNGEWICGTCHPCPNEEDRLANERSTLIARIKLGNSKLYAALQALSSGELVNKDVVKWREQMARYHEAEIKLNGLCRELNLKYHFGECLYLDETGKKTRGCLNNSDGATCVSCTCKDGRMREYCEKELMELPHG